MRGLPDLLHARAGVVLGQTVLAAVGRLARVALPDDRNRRLGAALSRVEHRPAALLAPAAETEREVDRVAGRETVRVEGAGLELVGAEDEALLVGRDRSAVLNGEAELGDGAGGCAEGREKGQ